LPQQVWLALTLLHLGELPPTVTQAAGWFAAASAGAGVAYLPKINRQAAGELHRYLTEAKVPTAVYAHQPSVLQQQLGLPKVKILPIPATIAQRFGLEVLS